ncbi:Cytochrome c oxidase protein 20 [Paramyrothecium foliicola]|nr:Cytochrome c oxidase protein 20 [Paramyrothecium foliicola]
MAGNAQDGQPGPNEKTLHVWGKPLEHQAVPEGSAPVTPPARATLSETMSSITKDDFLNVPNTPCSREGLLTGIATGAGVGGLKFVIHGKAKSAANWAVGFFILASTASYEYCQYRRRAERTAMKRSIEIVHEKRKVQLAEERAERLKQAQLQEQQQQEKAAQKSWYKFW